MATAREGNRGTAPAAGGDGLVVWAARSGRPENWGPVRGGLRFVFYGRVSTEDSQDPVTSRARQREQAGALVRGHGVIVAEFFDAGQSRTVAWGRRPEAAALVAQLADPDRGWDAIVVGENEHAMTVLGLSSKREVTRTSIRVRTAMAVQARYLGGRPPYGYRLGDAGPHPNKAYAAWGRRAHRLEPDPETAHVVRWLQHRDGRRIRMRHGQDRHQAHPAVQDQEQHERGAREPHPAAQRDTEQRAAERWHHDLPDQDGDPR